jgi:ribosome-binding protein aMBF1 (putative translation factor)
VSAAVNTDDDTGPGQGRCWCCGRPYLPEEMVHLGAHPEVTVCRDCARYLNRRAATLPGPTTPMRVVRRATQAARDRVMARNLHESRILGPLLRWLDKHLP